MSSGPPVPFTQVPDPDGRCEKLKAPSGMVSVGVARRMVCMIEKPTAPGLGATLNEDALRAFKVA